MTGGSDVGVACESCLLELLEFEVEEFKNSISAGLVEDSSEGWLFVVKEVLVEGIVLEILDLSNVCSRSVYEIYLFTSFSFFWICSGEASFLN